MSFPRSLSRYYYTLLLALPFPAAAQIEIRGRVVDAATKEPVSFATVGLKQQNTGTNADEQGTFAITAQDPGDTLMLLCVGYRPQALPLPAMSQRSDLQLTMQQQDVRLPEARVVASRKVTTEHLNPFKPAKIHRFINSNGYEIQIAQHFTNPHPQSRLSSVTLYLRDEPGKHTSFRLRVYEADSLGRPGNDLYPAEILISYRNETPLVVDLEPYNIYVPGKDFFVAVEWLKIADNDNGGTNSFRPIIGFSNKGSRTDHVWRQNYRNEWYQRDITIGKGNLAISARLTY